MRNYWRRARREARARAAALYLLNARHTRDMRGARAFGALALVCWTLLALFAAAGPASAMELAVPFGAPLLGMAGLMIPRPMIQRLDPKVGYNGEGSVATFELQRALLYRGLVLHGNYTVAVAADAASVKTYALPIERIDVEADNGTVLHSVRPTDLIREKQCEARVPLAAMLTVPSGFTAAGSPYTGVFDVPLSFDLDDVKDGQDFMLPAWRFEQVQVKVYFTNTFSNIYTGGTSGGVTMQALSLNFKAVVDLPSELIADPNYLIQNSALLLRSFKEVAAPGAANTEFIVEVPRSADIERIYIITENATRDPVSTILNAVSLVENGQVRRLSKVPVAALRALESENQQATLPTGWHVIDFTQPSDTIQAALPATGMNSLDLVLDVNNPAGFIRAVFVRKAP